MWTLDPGLNMYVWVFESHRIQHVLKVWINFLYAQKDYDLTGGLIATHTNLINRTKFLKETNKSENKSVISFYLFIYLTT